MKPQGAHAHEDRLLDFAYGELPPSEAQVMEQHVQGCSRCSAALSDIRGVRTTMSRLPLESAPDAGLESLLAYAQQSARRSAAGPEPAPRWWRRLLAPALGVAAVSVFGVVVLQVNRTGDFSPAAIEKKAVQEQVSQRSKDGVSPTAASPAAPAPKAVPASAKAEQLHEELDEQMRSAPAEPIPTKSPRKPSRRADWSNSGMGSAGGFPEKKIALADDADFEDLSKAKRGAAMDKNAPSVSPARSAEPPAEQEMVAAAAPGAAGPMPGESQAAQYAPPRQTLKIGGSTSRPSSVASIGSYEDAAPKQAPGRAQAPASAPPSPPPPVAEYQPPAAAPATAGAIAQTERAEARKADEAANTREKASTARISPSPAELLKQADVASRSGDKAQEVALLRAALSAGAQGAQRLDALSRLCDAEFELGRRQSAIDICKRLMAEAPGSREARLAQRRLESELSAPADESKLAQ